MLFLISLALWFSNPTTNVYLIGSPHHATIGSNKNDLFQAIEKCKPDIILVECDSAMLGSNFRFSANLLSVYEFGIAEDYASKHPEVILRPFDIEGRNDFFQRNQFFQKQTQFFNELGEADERKQLSPENLEIYHRLIELNGDVEDRAEMELSQLNSSTTDSIVQNKMDWFYGKFSSLINSTPKLIAHIGYFQMDSSFWKTRNEKMAEHILQYCHLYPGKNIVVLTGFYHRYYLKKLLAASNDILVKEYYKE